MEYHTANTIPCGYIIILTTIRMIILYYHTLIHTYPSTTEHIVYLCYTTILITILQITTSRCYIPNDLLIAITRWEGFTICFYVNYILNPLIISLQLKCTLYDTDIFSNALQMLIIRCSSLSNELLIANISSVNHLNILCYFQLVLLSLKFIGYIAT